MRPAARPRVVSCRYMRLSCSEDDHPLFRQHYARSNREKGVKLMRCFPHCCPEHAQRCYCGTSVHALVTFATELPVAAQRNIVVCARFEPSRVVPLWPANLVDAAGDDSQDNERKLQPGEVVSLPESVLHRSSQEEEKLWVRADREGDVKHQTLPKNAALYVLNNHRFPKWFYNYDSSITRTQREMTHHLALYVFQLTGSRSRSGDVDVLVLARHQSPAFKLISYRRSGNNATDAGCDLPAIDVAEEAFTAIDIDVNAPDIAQDGVASFASKDLNCEVLPKHFSTARPEMDTKTHRLEEIPSEVANRSMHDTATLSFNSSRTFWESGLAEKAKHLLILWRFLGTVPIADAGIRTDKLDTEIRSHWMRLARAVRAPPDRVAVHLETVLSSFYLSICPSSSPGMEERVPREFLVVQAATQLLLRALASQAVQYVLQSAFSLEADTMEFDATDEVQLRERFFTLVLDLYDVLEDLFQLGSHTTDSVFPSGRLTLPALVDEVLSLIFRQKQFSSLRADVTALLMGVHSQPNAVELLYHAFKDQTRELELSRGNSLEASLFEVDTRCLWSRLWLLEPGSVHVSSRFMGQKQFMDPSIVDLARWLHDFACVDIATRDNKTCVFVRSMLPLVEGLVPLELVVDGRHRHFPVTPSGIASVISSAEDWTIGDYAACFANSDTVLEVDFYAFKETDRQRTSEYFNAVNVTHVRRLRMTFTLEQNIMKEDPSVSAYPPDEFIIFHGIVAEAEHTTRRNAFQYQNDSQRRFSEISPADRSLELEELRWRPQFEINGGYVAIPASS